jgi:hypothetical protein
MKIGGIEFDIDYYELNDLLNEITDEFPELIYDVESSSHSSLIMPDDNSFIITFQQDGESSLDIDVLHYIEPKIWQLIRYISSQLGAHGLYVSDSDFGQSDIYYELVISKIGHKPKPQRPVQLSKDIRDRGDISEDVSANASTAGMGDVSNAGVSSTSMSASVSGSGDVSNTLKSKSQKMGGPSQVSDLRFLKSVKIKRVKDI